MLQKYHGRNIAKFVDLLLKINNIHMEDLSAMHKNQGMSVSFLTKPLLSGMHWFRSLEMSVIQHKAILDPLGETQRRICTRWKDPDKQLWKNQSTKICKNAELKTISANAKEGNFSLVKVKLQYEKKTQWFQVISC